MLTKIFLVSLYLSHLGMVVYLLINSKRMGGQAEDERRDPFFSYLNVLFSYIPIFGAELYGLFISWNNTGNDLLLYLGGLIYLGGMILRIVAIRTLGIYFTMEIGTRKNHHIITSGPYKYLRHPSYTGYLMMIIGMGIAYQSLVALFIPLVEILIFFSLRIREEEKMLTEKFPEDYPHYQKKTKRLIPWLY